LTPTNQPSLTKERFLATPTFAEYVEGMTVNREAMLKHVEEVEVSDADKAWWASRGNVKVYVLTFDGSGDALYNLPVLGKIAKLCPNVEVRVAQRDENVDIMDEHLNQGLYRSVPLFIFLDENYLEIANLKERAESITKVLDHEQLQLRRRLREENKIAWRAEMLGALKGVAETLG
jgi:hypothetical protein